MKQRRTWFLLVFSMVFVVFLSGCTALDSYEKFENDQDILFVSFSTEEKEEDPFDHRKLDGYKSEFSPYNSYVLYSTLSEKEKKIYRFYEYALDHGYTSVFIDSRLIDGLSVTPLEILNFLTMDSALVQQNYEYAEGEMAYSFSYFYNLLDFDVNGLRISTKLFDEKALNSRKEVIAAAEDVLKKMPEGLSDLEKARYFYRYLTREVEYYFYDEEEEISDYLHDAFYLKRTQCDGFANAFSLFCAMEKIPCFEKIYDAKSEEEVGHTWNTFYADGNWYNADCAVSGEVAENQKRLGMDFYFGFSDERQEVIPLFAERLPSCEDNLIPIDLVISSPSDPLLRQKIGKAFAKTEREGILIRIENGNLEQGELGRIANYLDSDLYSIPAVWNGVNHIYLFRGE